MRTISDIYKEYRIPPWLQMHQLRVAAVGSFVAQHFQGSVNQHDVIVACLLHDVGAIVKFDFNSQNPDLNALYDANDRGYWLQVQQDFQVRYGTKEHPATDAILKELKVSESVERIIQSTGFQNMEKVIAAGFVEAQIVQYADMRVGLDGITSLEKRLADVKVRYAKPGTGVDWDARMENNLRIALDIETRLFSGASVVPHDITNESATLVIEELKNFAI